MKVHFQREIDKLKQQILGMSAEVEEAVADAVRAVETRDPELAKSVLEKENQTNAHEVDVEEECLKILALHQPVARDLRFVIAVLKINNDLERIGDIVVNIADRGIRLTDFPVIDLQEKIMLMGRVGREMLKESLDALIALDVRKAVAVIARDDEVDRLNIAVINGVVARATPENTGAMTESLILIHSIARDLERIGDHATNIAEDVAYLVDGTIIRHKHTQQV